MRNMISDFKVASSQCVDVTHINDPHSFYVRSANVKDSMEAIERPGNPMSDKEIKLGQRIIYKSNVLGKYVRGDICFINIDELKVECDIFAVDYGCFEKSILLEHIHSLDFRAKPENQCPALAFHCQLYLCEPRGDTFTEKVIDTMRYFVGEHTATVTIMSKLNNKLIVELRTVECPGDVATMMGLLHLTTLTKYSNTVNRFYNSSARLESSSSALNLTQILNYKHRDLKVGDILQVRVQSGTLLSGFYVAEMNEYKKFINLQPSFSMYCKDRQMQDQDIVPGRPCAVRVGNPAKYERAIVKEITEPNSKAILRLVDWGKDVESYFSCIKSVISEMYFTQPILAIYCSTDEDQVWDTGLPQFLFPGYEFVIRIMEVRNGLQEPHRVNIYPWKM